MFEREITLNEFLLGGLDKLAADVSAETLFDPSPGHGHSPAWIIGHLAIAGEMGLRILGGELVHPQWAPIFGPGSAGVCERADGLDKETLLNGVRSAYKSLRAEAASAQLDAMSRSHSLDLLKGTPIRTFGDLVAHLLTTHFAFHLSQLSSCRRSAGFKFLF
jgi:hypothetical protein